MEIRNVIHVYFTALLLFISGVQLFGQFTLDDLMNDPPKDCIAIDANATERIVKYYEAEKYDSLKLVLDYRLENCVMTQRFLRFSMLWDIRNEQFEPDNYKDKWDYLLNHQTRYSHFDPYYSFNYRTAWDEKFRSISIEIARELTAKEGLTELERLIANYYGGDKEPLKNALEAEQLAGTDIQTRYNAQEEVLKKRIALNLGLTAGTWIPQDALSILGVHPEIGFYIGGVRNRFYMNATFNLRFLKSPNEISVLYQDSVVSTDYFTGLYAGINPGYRLFDMGNMSFFAIGGVGIDLINTIRGDTENGVDPNYLNSFTLNTGLEIRYNYREGAFLGLEGRYNFLNYTNTSNTDLSGNALTIKLIWGFSDTDSPMSRGFYSWF